MDLGLKNRTYLVMGASRGLGKAVQQCLLAEGARVIGTSRQPGCDAQLDTADESSRQAFLTALQDTPLDGIFVNTGGPRPGDFLELDDADWAQAFSQLLLGPLSLVRHLLPQVNDGGSILFNTSSSIQVPIRHLVLSNVFRAAIYALAKSLVDDLSPRRIRVNVIVPGRIATSRVVALDQAQAERQGRALDEVQHQEQADIPMGRYGTPGEFGDVAAFLLSPVSQYINGTSIWVDGGKNRAL